MVAELNPDVVWYYPVQNNTAGTASFVTYEPIKIFNEFYIVEKINELIKELNAIKAGLIKEGESLK